MGNFRLNEAFKRAKDMGGKFKKIDLAAILWKDSTLKTAHTNFSNLANGRSKKINIDDVPVICEYLGVTADYLFGMSDCPTRGEEFDTLKSQVAEYLDSTMELNEAMRQHIN